MNKKFPPNLVSAPSRRQFLQLGGAAALACAAATVTSAEEPQSAAEKPAEKPAKKSAGKTLNLGIASYTFRAFDLDKTLAFTKRAGLKNVCLKSVHLPLSATPEELAAVAAKVAAAGLTLYGGGVIEMSKEAQITQAFEYGKAAGLRVLVISPDPAMLPLIEQQVKKYDISVAIHNHGPDSRRFPTPQSAYEKIASLDRRAVHRHRSHGPRGRRPRRCGEQVPRPSLGHARQGRHRGHGQGPLHSTRPRRDRYPRAASRPGRQRLSR
jgi:hypothetical protein